MPLPSLKKSKEQVTKLALARLRAHEESAGRPAFPTFNAWLKQVTPAWQWDCRHLTYMQSVLDRVTAGELEKVMFFCPPRHGKSEQNTIRYPIYRIEKNPELRTIIWAYNQTFAEKLNRKARRIAVGRLALSTERKSAEDWETLAGGGIRAAGAGTGVTGMGANLILIDDPIKSREEAESQTYRDKVWEGYLDDLYTRQEPDSAICLTMTRWHEDDLAGRILNSDDGKNWHVVKLPAFAEEDDPLGREEGEPLWPERYDEDKLSDRKLVLGASFEALFQQRPTAKGGSFFKREWFENNIVPFVPVSNHRVRFWDLAASKDGDWTVGTRMSRVGDTYYVEDVVRGRWSPQERDAKILATAHEDGISTRIGFEQEPGASGKAQSDYLVRMLAGFIVYAEKASGAKDVRAGPFASQCEAGNVRLVRGDWHNDFLAELAVFPNGKHDDQVDSCSGAFNRLALVRPSSPSIVGGARDYTNIRIR